VSSRQRLLALGLVLAAVVAGLALAVFAANACPAELPGQPCPDAPRNRAIVVSLAAVSVGLLVAPFAYLAEFLIGRRIVYRGAWLRAARRGLLAGAVVAVLAGLRLGGALSVPVGLFVLILAGIVEWFAVRR